MGRATGPVMGANIGADMVWPCEMRSARKDTRRSHGQRRNRAAICEYRIQVVRYKKSMRATRAGRRRAAAFGTAYLLDARGGVAVASRTSSASEAIYSGPGFGTTSRARLRASCIVRTGTISR